MQYVLLGLLIVVIILLSIVLIRSFKKEDNNIEKNLNDLETELNRGMNETINKNNLDLMERIHKLENELNNSIKDFETNMTRHINEDFVSISKNMNDKIDVMNNKVSERIDENFSKTNKTFSDVIERLAKIDQAQKKIDELSSDIINLQSVLTDKKTRGIFGEVNLNYILTNIFGEERKLYDIQHKLSNDTIVDSIVFAPEPLGNICIDSKFPFENFERMTNKNLSKLERDNAEKLFKGDLKKHIDAISSKYIIEGETAKDAIMFLPAEALFAEINAYHSEVLQYAYKKHVWICGPTTLMSTLTTISMIFKNIERDKYSKTIHEELNKLGIEFSRFKDRFDKLSKSIKTVNNDVDNCMITTEKIKKKFDSISNVSIDTEKSLELPENIEDLS